MFSNLWARFEVKFKLILTLQDHPTFPGGLHNMVLPWSYIQRWSDGRSLTLMGQILTRIPISISKKKIIIDNQDNAIVVRAKVITDDDQKSETITHTYFVNQDIQERFTLPVISLVTDASNLFDEDTGIYTEENASMVGIDWERPIHIEFFEKDGSKGFGQKRGFEPRRYQ